MRLSSEKDDLEITERRASTGSPVAARILSRVHDGRAGRLVYRRALPGHLSDQYLAEDRC